MSARSLKNFNLLLMGIAVLYFMVNTASSLKPNADIIEKVDDEISHLREYKKDYDSKQVQNIEVKASQFIINERTKLRDKLYANDNIQFIHNEIKKSLSYSEVCMNKFLPSSKLMEEIKKKYQDCAYRITFKKAELSQKIAQTIEEGTMLKVKLDGIKMNCFLKRGKSPNPDDDMKICLNNDGILVAGGYLKEVRSLSPEGYAESQAYKCIEELIIRHRTDKTLVASAQACEKNRVG
ncbi:hypothetical protein HCN44_004977 [Aphidius gifuensis]|uniref:Odorant-binding protein n=1 Tax=Aphidius gifuensis TaxID=684658 RepID=A0A834XUA6_APHGI|nr:hypothetical protein HCN44_004977 [Aphidius gifuensis]